MCGCVFCEMMQNQIDACKVFEDSETLAFLDIRPVYYGHTLVVPKKHIVTLMEADDETITTLFKTVRIVSRAVQKAMTSGGIFIAANNLVSQSVLHLHIHVIPRSKGDNMRHFLWPRKQYESELQMRETGESIRRAIEGDRQQ